MAVLKQATNYNRAFFMVESADHHTPRTGATVTVTLSKAGAAFAASSGGVTEIGSGWYYIILSQNDVGTLGDLAFHCTASSADPTDFVDQVQTQLFSDLQINASGEALVASNVKQNVATNGFSFVMTDSTTHFPATGKTVTAQRSLAGAGFGACSNTVSEVSNGVYTINLSAADLNATSVMLRFTASGCDDLNILLIPQP